MERLGIRCMGVIDVVDERPQTKAQGVIKVFGRRRDAGDPAPEEQVGNDQPVAVEELGTVPPEVQSEPRRVVFGARAKGTPAEVAQVAQPDPEVVNAPLEAPPMMEQYELSVPSPKDSASTFVLPEDEPLAPVPEQKLESPMLRVAEEFARKVRAQLHGDDAFGAAAEVTPTIGAQASIADEVADLVDNPLDRGLTDELRHLLAEKEEEFHLLGYGEVRAEDIWQYLCALRKKRPTNLHDLVNAVLSLQPQAYMNHAMKSMYQPVSLDDFRELL